MKHTLSKPVKFTILCSGELIDLHLQPVTFRRLIDITAALEGKDLTEVLLDPTPLQIAAIAYCMLNKLDRLRVEDFKIIINDEDVKVNGIQKLYYIVTESNVQEGYTNYTSMIQAVNKNIIDSFPEAAADKKKVLKVLKRSKSRSKLKKYLILLAMLMVTLLINFLMRSPPELLLGL